MFSRERYTHWSASTNPRHNVDLRLTTDGTYWYIVDQDNTVDKYDMTGKLVQVTYRGGYYQTFTYDGSGNIEGRKLPPDR